MCDLRDRRRATTQHLTWLLQGAYDTESFFEAFKNKIMPHLRPYPQENSVVVIDNCRIHNIEMLKELVEGVGAIVEFLPPYSPDFNPIELVFGQAKKWLKRHACETVTDTYALDSSHVIIAALSSVSQDDVRAYVAHDGYDVAGELGCAT